MYGIKYDNYIQRTMAMAIDRKNLKESIDINVDQIELIIVKYLIFLIFF